MFTVNSLTPGESYLIQEGIDGEELIWTIRKKTVYVRREYKTNEAAKLMQKGGSSDQIAELQHEVVYEIQLPSQYGDLKYEFEYYASDTPLGSGFSDGWGEIKSVKTPAGAEAEYEYKYPIDILVSKPYTNHILKNGILKKTLSYNDEYDGVNVPVEQEWEYDIGDQSTMVISPDGSEMTQWHGDTTYRSATTGLVLMIENGNGTMVEKIWEQNVTPWEASGKVNPFVKMELTSIKNANGDYALTTIKEFTQDKNGNTTSVKEYDFVPYANVPRTEGFPTGLPSGACGGKICPSRTTLTNYNNAAPDSSDTSNHANAYWNFSNIKGVVASTEVRNSANSVVAKTEITYDNPSTTANPILTRTWDSAKGSLSTPLNDGNSVKSQATYNAYGMPLTTTDANGTVTQITYGCIDGSGSCDDEYKNLYPTQTVAAYNTALARTSKATYDFFTGAVLTTTDVDNNITNAVEYDDIGRPLKSILALGTALESWTTSEYYDEDRFVVVKSDLEVKGDAKKVAIQHFDQLGRVRLSRTLENVLTQSPYNETHGIKVQTRYITDDPNSYRLTSNPYRADYSYNETDSTMGWTRSKSWNHGKKQEIETFSGSALPAPWGGNSSSTGVVTTEIDAERTLVTDQAGKQRISRTNALGQLTDIWEIMPASDGDTVSVTFPNTSVAHGYKASYSYDTLSNLTTVNQGVQTRTFTYSSLSRLLTANNPESGAISYSYDDNGNLTSKVDARTITTSYVYDALNRVTQRNYSDSTPNVGYTYKTSAPALGSLIKVESTVSTTEYTGFDILGRVTGHKQTTDGEEYDTEYVYNLSGGLVEQTYPSGRKVKNVIDQNGYLSMVQSAKCMDASPVTNATCTSQAGLLNYASSFIYNAVGAVTSMQLGNGKWESTQFNSRLQPTQIGLGATQGATNFLKLDYSYGGTNNNGNVQSQTITIPTVGVNPGFTAVQNYTYDSLNRIKTAEETIASSQTWKQAFIYDRYGNRNFDEAETTTLLKNCTESSLPVVCAADRKIFNPSANASNNRLSSADDYVFDNAGNTTSDPQGRTFTYDAENKQVEVKNHLDQTIGLYFYDGDGKRIKKYVPATGETTVFVYDAAGKLIADYSTELAPDPKVSYTTADHLGSPRILTDENGEIISRRDFHPFGEETATTERTAPLGYQVDDVRQKFTTYERDKETDLDFAQARMHSYDLGRFTSPDNFLNDTTQIDPSSWNLYVYVRNNPLKYSDPTGQIIHIHTNDPKERQQLLDDLNYTYGCNGCVTIAENNTLSIDTSSVSASVLKAAKFLTDAITSTSYEAAVFISNNDENVHFGMAVEGGATIGQGDNMRKIDAIILDFKDRDALIGSQEAKDAFAKLTFAHEVAHLYPPPGLNDPDINDGRNKTGATVDATNEIALAKGILLRATYYGQLNEASQYFGYIYMGQPQYDKKTKQVKRDRKTNGILVEKKQLLQWNRLLIKGMN